jgi:hypothetical protein
MVRFWKQVKKHRCCTYELNWRKTSEDGSEVKKISYLPIRIYPLSDLEFKDISSIEAYFTSELKNKCGKFYYRNKPIVAESGTIVLFQYNQHIVAQAELMKVHKFKEPMIVENIEYHGYFLFDPETVHYYSKSLSENEFYEYYPDRLLGRVTHILDNEKINRRLLKKLSELKKPLN